MEYSEKNFKHKRKSMHPDNIQSLSCLWRFKNFEFVDENALSVNGQLYSTDVYNMHSTFPVSRLIS